MVFSKQYSKRALTLAAPGVKREVPASVKCHIQGRDILAVQGPMAQYVVPCLGTPDLLHLAATCKDLWSRLGGLVLYLRVGVDFRPQWLTRVLVTLMPTYHSLRILDMSGGPAGSPLCPEHLLALASALHRVKGGGLAPSLRVLSLRRRPPPFLHGGTQAAAQQQQQVDKQAIEQILCRMAGVGAWSQRLQSLDLSGHPLTGQAALGHLLQWLREGHGRRLRRLSLSAVGLHTQELLALVKVLGDGDGGGGACPQLVKLDLLRACHHHHQHDDHAGGGGVVVGARVCAWAKALNSMPGLRELELDESGVEEEVALALGQVWGGGKGGQGGGRRLRRIDMAGCTLTHQAASCLLRGLSEGSCPALLALGLRDTTNSTSAAVVAAANLWGGGGGEDDDAGGGDGVVSSWSLFELAGGALRSGALQHLRRLDLSQNKITYEGMREVVDALSLSVCPKLEVLELESLVVDMDMDEGGGCGREQQEEVNEMVRAWLAKLKEDGHCPRLRLPHQRDKGGGDSRSRGGARNTATAATQ